MDTRSARLPSCNHQSDRPTSAKSAANSGTRLLPDAAAADSALDRLAERYALILLVAVAVGISVLGWAAQRQCLVWRNDETLWRRGVAVQPERYFAQYNLAKALLEAARAAAMTRGLRDREPSRSV